MAIRGDSRLQRNPDVVYQELGDGQGVLLHLESGQYHGLNPIGSAIWGLIDGKRTRSEIVAQLSDRLDDSPPDLEGDVTSFLDDLHERDLILD
jgi:hypothetical protein